MAKVSYCPRCKQKSQFGKGGFKFPNMPQRLGEYNNKNKGPWCLFCAIDILNAQLPNLEIREGISNPFTPGRMDGETGRVVPDEEKGNENAD